MTIDHLLDALRTVIDPEVGINIVDLGLIYELSIEEGAVEVSMTMTSPACPMGDYLCEQARAAIQKQAPEAKSVVIKLVFDPPWSQERISEAAKSQLGWT